ncbi:NADP-dependent phosphogluconate dehydrogenase [Kordia zhangzhouensis]|uniref:NADP-dependent phosphogluconate dehydrogenase n=1 Tax=Kordia zhangzhouensis TaxID=1620405 RepID=UPI0006290724|nr:NADP-dependent phosphogluconate dehydrogenase [Kordia zhangzhouensis]
MKNASFGIIGLGVMGKSIAINALNKNISVAVYNRETTDEVHIAQTFAKVYSDKQVQGFSDIQAFVNALETPRKILLMVNAGKAVDQVIATLLPYLSAGDILLDGGNSHYKDTNKRILDLKKQHIHLLSVGISGGEEGALTGPSLMPGGDKESYLVVKKILEMIAAKDADKKPCCAYIGNDGSGHFVKMVHNGIEYGDMQLLAELYEVLSLTCSYNDIATIFRNWNQTELQSYLLEITADILTTKEGNTYVLDTILDKAGNKGTGSWSSIAAMELGVPTTIKTSAVYARYLSSLKEKRAQLAISKPHHPIEEIAIDVIKRAYKFTRLLNLHQGFELLRAASKTYEWQLQLAEICRIWSNGCIIKSAMLKQCMSILKEKDSLLDDETIIQQLTDLESDVKKGIQYALQYRLNIPCITAAYSYWLMMTTQRTSANMIQAQRDFFGAHTFQRVNDASQKQIHYHWKK